MSDMTSYFVTNIDVAREPGRKCRVVFIDENAGSFLATNVAQTEPSAQDQSSKFKYKSLL